MKDTVNFTLLGAGYFCILINIVKVYSGTQLIYLGIVGFFSGLAFRLY